MRGAAARRPRITPSSRRCGARASPRRRAGPKRGLARPSIPAGTPGQTPRPETRVGPALRSVGRSGGTVGEFQVPPGAGTGGWETRQGAAGFARPKGLCAPLVWGASRPSAAKGVSNAESRPRFYGYLFRTDSNCRSLLTAP